MPLVRGQAKDLLKEANNETLHRRLAREYHATQLRPVNARELQSWRNSLGAFLEVLDAAGLGDSEVLLEHTLPRSSLRIDAVVCGHNPETARPSYVFVELKQWDHVHSMVGSLVRQHERDELRTHPVDQVRGYCRYVQHSIPLIAEDKKLVSGIAYLHNAKRPHVELLLRHQPDHWGELYTADDRSKLEERLARLLDRNRPYEDNVATADRFLSFPVRPSAEFIEIIKNAVLKRQLLPLVDQQRAAYQLVEDALVDADEGAQKTVVIVVGGPGSGKSAIALSLLGRLEELDMRGYHTTGSKAFTETLRLHLDRDGKGARDVFKYNNNFHDGRNRKVSVLVSDEAQRIRRSSSQSGSRRQDHGAEPQIAELIKVARVPVFLLDENQRVRADEVGSVDEITRVARGLGCKVEVINLRGQFRCGGSDAFDRWVDCLLGIVDEPPSVWADLESGNPFEVHVGDSPRDMENWFRARRAEDQSARMTAGFCWPWPFDHRSPKPDIEIGDWRRWWNLKKAAEDGPEHIYWATDPDGARQVGCVYTAQGFEYDWAGVIFGPDLVWRTDRWVARPERSFDSKAKENRALFPELVRNAYRVLLTRGMRGVTMFSVDPETQQHLRAMVGRTAA